MGPVPVVAAVRRAVREQIDDLEPGALVLAACSGGADSLALAAALAVEAPRRRLLAGAITVDHGLTADSAQQAARVLTQVRELGLVVAESVRVTVAGPGGPEAAARRARYAALESAAVRLGAVAVLLGHTRDDQAETVLLGLARGAGARSLAGMPTRRGPLRRPLLELSRATTVAACAAEGLQAWFDPHNGDPAYARVRVRQRALPVLEETLGPGVTAALARTADLLRADADALDAIAADAHRQALAADGSLDVAVLARLPTAVRTRVLRAAALAAGSPGGALSAVHVSALDALVTDWHGQQAVALPGSLAGVRRSGRLHISEPTGRELGLYYDADISSVVVSAEQIQGKLEELAAAIDADYAGREVLLVGVLKGAVMVMADLARKLTVPVTMDFMAVSSYGSATSSSGVVRILKDLDRDIAGQHVLIVEDIIDSGLTLSWLLRNVRSRGPASVEICALLRKREAAQTDLDIRYVGFDIPSEFVVGYGLDYAERYRTLPFVGLLRPHVYAG